MENDTTTRPEGERGTVTPPAEDGPMTTEPTSPLAWLESICPPELRAEVDELVTTINRYTEELAPHLARARELLASFVLKTHRAQQAIPGAEDSIADLLDLATGNQALHDAVSDLAEACDPFSHPLYAAVVRPGRLACGVAIVVVGPDGVDHAVFMSAMNVGPEGKSFEVFDAADPAAARWEISRDELIAGVERGLALAAQEVQG